MSHYFNLPIADDLALVIPELTMAQELYDLVDSDRDHLRSFLSFVDSTLDVSHQIDFLNLKMDGAAKGTDRLFLITKSDKLIGSIDLHEINVERKKAEIGYWIHSDYAGQNIMTRAVNTLCRYSFDTLGLNKLTLIADIENEPSNKVAKKAGFHLVGVQPEEIILYGKYRHVNEYYLLKSEFI